MSGGAIVSGAVLLLVAGLLAAGLAGLGLWLVRVALVRRAGGAGHCAACDYPLRGLPDGATRCPECGGDLAAPGAIARGRRELDRPLLVGGLALCAPLVAAVALVGLAAARRARPAVPTPAVVNTRTIYLPTPTPTPPPRPSPPAPPALPAVPLPYDALADDALAGWVEDVAKRKADGDLASLLDEARRRAERAPDGPAPAWASRVADVAFSTGSAVAPRERLLLALDGRAWLDAPRRAAYHSRAVEVGGAVRAHVTRGDPVPYAYRARVKIGPAEAAARYRFRLVGASLGGVELPVPAEDGPARLAHHFDAPPDAALEFPPDAWRALPNGEHVARLRVRVEVDGARQRDVVVEQKVAVVTPIIPRGVAYTHGLDDGFAADLRVDGDDGAPGAGLTWAGDEIVLRLTGAAPQARDYHAQVTLDLPGTGQSFALGSAGWRRGERRTHVLRGRFPELRAHVGRAVSVTLAGDTLGAARVLDMGPDAWSGFARLDGVLLRDSSATPESAAPPVPTAHVFRIGVPGRANDFHPAGSPFEPIDPSDERLIEVPPGVAPSSLLPSTRPTREVVRVERADLPPGRADANFRLVRTDLPSPLVRRALLVYGGAARGDLVAPRDVIFPPGAASVTFGVQFAGARPPVPIEVSVAPPPPPIPPAAGDGRIEIALPSDGAGR